MAYSKEALDRFTQNYLASNASTPDFAPPPMNPLRRQTFQVPNFGTDGWSAPVTPVLPDQGGQSWLSRVSDVLGRGLSAGAGMAESFYDWAGGDDSADPGHAFVQGITGKEKKTYGDVLRHIDPEHTAGASAVGLLADFILDPLNAVPAAWIAAPFKMGAKGIAMTTRVGREANTAAKSLREAEKVAAAERANPIDEVLKTPPGEGVPEQTAKDIVDQIVSEKKAAETPDVTPVDRVMNGEEVPPTPDPLSALMGGGAPGARAPKPPEPPEEDFFPDFATSKPATATATAPEPPVSHVPDAGVPKTTQQADQDLLGGMTSGFDNETFIKGAKDNLAKNKPRLEELRALPNPTEEQLKEIKKLETLVAAHEDMVTKLGGTLDDAPQPSVVDAVATEKVATDPTIEAKPSISEDIVKGHEEEMIKGKTQDIGNMVQSDQMKSAIVNARRKVDRTKADYPTRQGIAVPMAVKEMKDLSERARAIGNEPFVEAGSGKRYPISMDQAISSLANHGHEETVSRALYNTAHEIGPHAFNAGLAELLHHADTLSGLTRDEVVDNIVEAMQNVTTDTYKKIHGEHKSSYVRNSWGKQHIQAQHDVAEAMVDSIDDLVQIAAENQARYAKRVAQETETLGKVTNERVAESMKPETSASEAAETINDIPAATKKAADEIKATPEARANGAVNDVKTVADSNIDVKSTEAASKKADATAKGDQKKVEDTSKAEASRASKDFEEISNKADPANIHDADITNAAQLEGIVERIVNWFGTKFLPNYGAAQLADFWRVKKSFNSSTAARFGNVLNSLAKQYKPEDIKEAWKILRDTTKTKHPEGLTPEMDQLVKDLHVAAGAIYDFRGMGDSPFYTSFMQIGLDLRKPENWNVINRALARRQAGFQFKTVKNGKKLSRTEIASQYLDWEVENPLEFLHKSFEALRDLATHKAIVDHAISKWGVTKPRAGYVKYTASKGESDLADFFPTTTTYYLPKEAAKQMDNLQKIMRASTSFNGQPGAFAKFMRDTVDPMIQLWKTMVTIVRPSHHMRNMVGDMSASWLDGVYSPAPYRKAMGMLINNRQKKSFKDMVEQIQGTISPVDAKQVLNPRFNVTLKNGQIVKLDDVMMHRLAYQHGILPLFTSVEDIITTSNRGLGRVSTKVMESKPIKFAGNISEKTSHVGRLSHYLALMERKSFTNKFASLEDASMAASKRVRQFHPDSSGLTAYEQKYMRRVFPFYSWFRQAAPTFAARLVTKPARFNDLNKVQYEFAQAAGVNPQSLSDPFPEDKEFPSWLRSSMTGPWTQGGTTMNFGTPVETIAGLINQTPETTGPGGKSGNPQVVEQLLNMLNPAIKAPIELNSQSMVTNRPISDTSEYWDSLIPGLKTVGSAFGSWSPSGTAMNILTGQNTGGPGPVDPMQSRLKNGENAWLNRGLLNFILGISSNDAYSPTSQKIANTERLTRVNAGA